MSMLSLQVDGLREMAVKLGVNGVCTGDLSELCVMLREAADTIESMRDRLQAAELGSVTCKVVKTEERVYGGEGADTYEHVFSCGHAIETFDEVPPNYCPNCGKRIRKKVEE